jgi:RNA polymerase sigma-70 factor (ECF subfamily)
MVTDDLIVKECRRGKRKGYSLLYRKYSPVLLGLCIRYTRSRDEAEDVLQEGFIKVFQKIKTFENKGSFEGWLKRIMVNTAINYYKSSRKYMLHEEFDVNNIRHTHAHDAGETVEIENPLKQEQLLAMINELPDGYRLIFNMYVFDGLTHKEIAEELGISEGTSKSQLSKARKHLKDKIEKIQQKMLEV